MDPEAFSGQSAGPPGQPVVPAGFQSISSNLALIAWSPDSKRLAGLAFNGVQIWDATTGAHERTRIVPADTFGILGSIAWSPNGQWIAVATETSIAVVNAQTGVLVHVYQLTSMPTSPTAVLPVVHGSLLDALVPSSGGGSNVSGLAWSPDSRQLAVTDYSTAVGHDNFFIINAQTGALIRNFKLSTAYGYTIKSWSPDGKYLATIVESAYPPFPGETSLWVWEASTGRPVLEQGLGEGIYGSMPAGTFAWQPNSDNLLFAEGNISNLRYTWEAPTAILWSVPQQKELKRYTLNNTGYSAWSPDGKFFATGRFGDQPVNGYQSMANQVAIIDAQSGQQLYVYHQNDYQVADIAWSPDGKYIASSGMNSVKTWIAP